MPFLATALELTLLFHHGTTPSGWPVLLPDDSPALRPVAARPGAGLVAGELQDVPVRVGLTTAYPNIGDLRPAAQLSARGIDPADERTRVLRPGSTVRGDARDLRGAEPSSSGARSSTSALTPPSMHPARQGGHRGAEDLASRGVPSTSPPARSRTGPASCPVGPGSTGEISKPLDPDEVVFLESDAPPAPPVRRRAARLIRWDGRSGEVEHDGTCDLILRRTYAPGWQARIDDGPEFAVIPADGGLQSIRLPGAGLTRVSVRYRPPLLNIGVSVSLAALGLAGLVIVLAPRGIDRGKKPPRPGSDREVAS